MFKFILQFIVFISPLVILIGITEYEAGFIPSNYQIKRDRLEKNIENAQVIITGSSHAYNGIKPSLLGVPATNIAYVGQDIYYDTRILLKYLPRAKNAKLVIITVSYHSLEYSMQNSVWGHHISFYKRFWGIDHEYPTFKLADYSSISLFGVQQSRDYFLTGAITETDQIDENGGNANARGTDNFAVTNGRLAVKRQDAETNLKYMDKNLEYLEELLSDLNERQIKAVFVTTPGFHSYYDNLDSERYARMQNAIQLLCQKYGLTYKNYLKDERFVAEDFSDSNHLSTKGMEKFSSIIKSEIVEEYVR